MTLKGLNKLHKFTDAKLGDKVMYDGSEYFITFVFNHGGSMLYFDLEEVEPIPGTKLHRKELSVHYSELN